MSEKILSTGEKKKPEKLDLSVQHGFSLAEG